METKIKGLNAGNWDAIHVVEVKPSVSGRADYKLTSTVMLRVAGEQAPAWAARTGARP